MNEVRCVVIWYKKTLDRICSSNCIYFPDVWPPHLTTYNSINGRKFTLSLPNSMAIYLFLFLSWFNISITAWSENISRMYTHVNLRLPLLFTLMHIFKAYSVLFLIFTYQTGARLLIYYTGKKCNWNKFKLFVKI